MARTGKRTETANLTKVFANAGKKVNEIKG